MLVGYEEPKEMSSDKDDKLEFTTNAKAMNALLSGLSELEFIKVMHCKTAKEIWDKLQNIHEGDAKVKIAKLEVYRMQFETLKMNEDENIAKFFLIVDEVVNIMLGLGETIKESVIVRKFLRSLPSKFNPKVSAIEKTTNFDILNNDQLRGSLTAYEMRIQKRKATSREKTFKVDKPTQEKQRSCQGYDEEEAKFVRRLKKDTSKYKGKLPFKHFNCGRVGQYASKFPFKKEENEFKGKEKDKSNKM